MSRRLRRGCVLRFDRGAQLGEGYVEGRCDGAHGSPRFPLAFFREGWHTRLGLAGTSVLLICLYKSRYSPWFQVRTEPQSAWYGISPDILQRGLDELREAKLLQINSRKIRDSKARYGTTSVNEYLLLGSFAHPDLMQLLIQPEAGSP
jgi:hypothetical protein